MIGECHHHRGHCNSHRDLMKDFYRLQRLEDNPNYHQNYFAYQLHVDSQRIMENRGHGQDHLGKIHVENYLF